ncbi:hypothetical protein L5G32_17305 [Gordonia sp. HY002]|nr:hypothetical protein [Gordonia zhenghanii]MCF8572028.1 hypothetical protein [Gordonia zhenghanii]MCF8608510.1 hypothetical protein [Gordonia zhenghanii]
MLTIVMTIGILINAFYVLLPLLITCRVMVAKLVRATAADVSDVYATR